MELVNIASMSAYHPTTEVATADLLEESGITKFGVPRDSVADMLKITHVRQSEAHVKPSHLASEASKSALKKANLSAKEIDLVIYCGIHKDADEPSTACMVADQLGMSDPRLQLAVDVTNACHGLTASIDMVQDAILAGKYENVLICSGEKPSNWFRRLSRELKQGKYSKEEAQNLVGFYSCGDVGAATVLQKSNDGCGIVYFKSATRPQCAMSCYVGLDEKFGFMDMRTISKQTLELGETMAPREICSKIGWDEPDILIQHQVGMKPYLKGLRAFGVKQGKCPKIFERLGNLTSASIVAAIEMAEIKKGDKVLVSSHGSGIGMSQYAFVANHL